MTGFLFGTIKAIDETLMSVISKGVLENFLIEGLWETCLQDVHQGGGTGKFTPHSRGKSIDLR